MRSETPEAPCASGRGGGRAAAAGLRPRLRLKPCLGRAARSEGGAEKRREKDAIQKAAPSVSIMIQLIRKPQKSRKRDSSCVIIKSEKKKKGGNKKWNW